MSHENPLVNLVLRRRVTVLGFSLRQRTAFRLFGLIVGAVQLALFSYVSQLRYYSNLSGSLIVAVLLAVGTLTSGLHFYGWARRINKTAFLRDLYLADYPRSAAGHGFLLMFMMPYSAVAMGAFVFHVLAALAIALSFELNQIITFSMLISSTIFVFIWLYVACTGILLINLWSSYIDLLQETWSNINSRAGYIRASLLIFGVPFVAVVVMVVVPSYLMMASVALLFAMITGDGAHEFLTPLRHHPLFRDDELF
jgi:hypothetical protein